ncbi:tyrosine-type recombinase/integrase [[Actinomadura] parvosata]|uniref:tyrosine-type recombinase/integrase n=1 Tax=[Actinomadura] parvosata TaxID=1955412 RepID=UPI00406CDD9F
MPSRTPSSTSRQGHQDPAEITSRKVVGLSEDLADTDDSLTTWADRYLALAVRGVRSEEVAAKITRHVRRFIAWLTDGLGHDRLSAVTPREITAWCDHLAAAGNRTKDGTPAPMAPATVNNHLAHLSALFTWIGAHAPAGLLRHGDPTKTVAPLRLPAPAVRALTGGQVRTVKNVLDRIEDFHQLTGRRHRNAARAVHRHARPLRDRAIVHLILGTGLRRAEVVGLDLAQLAPHTPAELRLARRSAGRSRWSAYGSSTAACPPRSRLFRPDRLKPGRCCPPPTSPPSLPPAEDAWTRPTSRW